MDGWVFQVWSVKFRFLTWSQVPILCIKLILSFELSQVICLICKAKFEQAEVALQLAHVHPYRQAILEL